MKENTLAKHVIRQRTNDWLKRTHLKRTEEEKQAYLNGMQDAGIEQELVDIAEETLDNN